MSVLQETPAIIAWVFAGALALLIVTLLLTNIETTGVFDASLMDQAVTFLEGSDTLVVLFFFGITIAATISAFFVRSHPIFFIFMLFILLVVIFIAFLMSDVFDTICDTPSFTTICAGLPMTVYLFEELVWFTVISAFMIASALWFKPATL